LEIELPDGTVLDAPDDADPKVVVANYMRKSGESETLNAMPAIDKFGAGLARPIIRTALGIKQLSGSPVNLDVDEQGGLIGTGSGEPALSDNDKAVLQHLSQVHGAAATTGDVLGNVAMLAAPGGAVSALPKTMALRAMGDVAANAGMGALAVPEEGRTRGQGAVVGALGSVGGQAVGKVLGALATGAKPYATAIAQRFMDNGIPLTPGQAVTALQGIEQWASKVPVLGSGIKARQKEAVSAWNLKMLADTANGVDTGGTGDLVNAAGQKGFAQAKKIFSDAYDFHWDRPMSINKPQLGAAWRDLVDDTQQQLGPEASNGILLKLRMIWENDLEPAINPKTGMINGTQLQKVDSGLGDAASDAARSGDGDVANFYSRARNDLRSQYPDSFRESLEALNRKYAEFNVLRRAGTALNGPAAGGPITPANLLSAAKALDRSAGKQATAQGTALMQPQAIDAMTVFPRNTSAPATMFEKTTLALPGTVARGLGLASRPVNNFLMGRAGWQDAIQKGLANPRTQAFTEALNQYLRSAQVGAAVGSD
jgi:hypothetical protein